MSVEHNKTVARRFFEEYIVEGKSNVHDIHSAPHFAYHMYGFETHSHKSFSALMKEIHQTILTDRSGTVDDLFGEGDRVALRFHLSGTHSAHYREHPATNQTLNPEGVFVFRFEGDLLAEVWVYYEGFDFDVSPK